MVEELKSEKLKKEKEGLIHLWMGLQDKAEGINERLFSVSVEIETLNAQIGRQMEKERRESEKKKKKPESGGRNGSARPK